MNLSKFIMLAFLVGGACLYAMQPDEHPHWQKHHPQNASVPTDRDVESQEPLVYRETDTPPPGHVVVIMQRPTNSDGNTLYRFLIPASAAVATVFLDYFSPQVSFLAYGAFGTGIKTSLRETDWKTKVYIIAFMLAAGYVIDKIIVPELFGTTGQIAFSLALSALVIVMKRSITEFIKKHNGVPNGNGAQNGDDSDDDDEEPKRKVKKNKNGSNGRPPKEQEEKRREQPNGKKD
jgi:hypothetical protein